MRCCIGNTVKNTIKLKGSKRDYPKFSFIISVVGSLVSAVLLFT